MRCSIVSERRGIETNALSKKVVFFFLGVFVATTVCYFWLASDDGGNAQVVFKLPENSTAFLMHRNEVTGRTQVLPIEASAGDVVKFTVSSSGEAMPLDKIFAMAISKDQYDKQSGAAEGRLWKISKEIEVVRLEHSLLKESRFNFCWQNPANLLLAHLRRREKLDRLLEGEPSEVKKFIRLQKWVRSQWEPGTPNPYPKWNAVEILDSIRAGKTGGFCGQYAQVLVQSLASLGYQARYVGLRNHIAVEAWSNELARWILLDPYSCVVFLRDGVYLNAHEIYRAARAGEDLQIHSVMDDAVLRPDGPRYKEILSRFKEFEVYLKNDHIEDNLPSDKVLADTWKQTVVLVDEYFGERKFSGGMVPLLTKFRSDLYFSLNRVEIKALDMDKSILTLKFRTNCPYPASTPFRVSMNGDNFTPSGDLIRWKLVTGRNLLKVRAVNSSGIAGPESVLELVKLEPPK